MDRELDTVDIKLLKDMDANNGEIGHATLDQRRRLDRLEMEGFVTSVRHDPPGLDAPPTWVYRLASKGRAALAEHHRSRVFPR